MSMSSIPDIVEERWGLTEEDLNKIIRIEGLKDLSCEFSSEIRKTIETFDSLSDMRIIAFNDNSGVDSKSKATLTEWISSGKTIFYYPKFSNKECCVVLIYDPKGKSKLTKCDHILYHEYAHHFQFTDGNFPYYVAKYEQTEWNPPFVNPCKVGPQTGSFFVDNLFLPDIQSTIEDSNERISDIICEGILRESDLIGDCFGYYEQDVISNHDPIDFLPIPHPSSLRRYVRRLVLRDDAEWGATVRFAYPKEDKAIKLISQGKERAIKMNKKYLQASWVYDEIFKLCFDTDFNSFRFPGNYLSYLKKILSLLNMKIKTSEDW
jgi:hypothetical protein